MIVMADRRHPVAAALWYAFCPQAAAWWTAGAGPEEPFDPYRAALADVAAGKTLRRALEERGFGPVLDEAPRYVQTVEQFRGLHRSVPAPERTLFFAEVFHRLPLGRRFGLDGAIATLGGDWDHFYTFIWTFAFGVEDWARAMGIPAEEVRVEAAELAVTAPKTRTVPFRVWRFTDGRQAHAAVLEGESELALAVAAHFGDFAALKATPAVWVLDRQGRAAVYDPPLNARDTHRVLVRLAEAARRRRPWPAGAFEGKCGRCAFAHLCWEEGKMRTEFVLREERTP